VVKVLRKAVGALSKVQCGDCNQTYELSLEKGEMTMHKSIELLEEQNAAMHAELAKAHEKPIELLCKMAEFTPEQLGKMDPDVKAQVRAAMVAALALLRANFGNGSSPSESNHYIDLVIASGQGVINLLDSMEEIGPTGSTLKSASGAADFEKMSVIDQIKYQQARPQLMHKRGAAVPPEGARVIDPRELIFR
jgi:hypothetical protein